MGYSSGNTWFSTLLSREKEVHVQFYLNFGDSFLGARHIGSHEMTEYTLTLVPDIGPELSTNTNSNIVLANNKHERFH